jgi:hypothetical protein
MVADFYNGLAGIRVNNKWGFIDKKGNIVISPRYDGIAACEGVFFAEQNRKWGIINADGDFVASPQFDNVGYSLVEYDYYSEINLK